MAILCVRHPHTLVLEGNFGRISWKAFREDFFVEDKRNNACRQFVPNPYNLVTRVEA